MSHKNRAVTYFCHKTTNQRVDEAPERHHDRMGQVYQTDNNLFWSCCNCSYLVWSFFLGRQEHARAYDEAVRQGNNLTLVLEEYVQRVILQSDNVLLALRRDYQRDPEHFDLVSWAKDTQFHKSLTANIGITDANGYVILSSLRYLPSPVYVGERPPFLFQRASSSSDRLFISDPVVGGVSKEPSI